MIPRAAFALLVVLLATVAVPFAANRMWAWAVLAIITGILMVGMALATLIRPANVTIPWRRYAWPATGYLLVLGWTLVQGFGLAPGLLDHPLWAETARALGRPLEGGASLDAPATLSEATRFIAYGGVFWLTMQFAGRDGRARLILWVVVLSIAANAAYGLFIQFTGANTVLWFQKWAYVDVVTGTFVNRNHFATYLGLGLIVVVALLVEELRRISAGVSARTIEGLVRLSEGMGPKFYLLAVLASLLSLAILLTGSRGALIAISCGIAALLGGIALSSRVSADRVGRLALALAGAGVAALVFSGEIVTNRIQGGSGLEERLALYGATIDAIMDRPLTGTGPGTFADVFMAYRPEHIGAARLELLYDHAHNTYLEVALESGVPALIVLLLVAAYGIAVYVRGVRTRRRNDLMPAIGIGATTLVAVHALFDFSLEIPAVAVTYLAIAGVAYAQSFNHAERSGIARVRQDGENGGENDGGARRDSGVPGREPSGVVGKTFSGPSARN